MLVVPLSHENNSVIGYKLISHVHNIISVELQEVNPDEFKPYRIFSLIL